MVVTRDGYGAIDMALMPQRTRSTANNLVNLAAQAEHVDEHGAWEFGAEWGEYDSKNVRWTQYGDKYLPPGWSCNWDLYGYGRDCHNRGFIALIQIRQAVRQRRGYHLRVRKNYFLVGRNEDGSVFAHPVGPHCIHAPIKKGLSPVKAAQDWIFGHPYENVKRQGDIGLIAKMPPRAAIAFTRMTTLIE